jgi:hypothetical protein
MRTRLFLALILAALSLPVRAQEAPAPSEADQAAGRILAELLARVQASSKPLETADMVVRETKNDSNNGWDGVSVMRKTKGDALRD